MIRGREREREREFNEIGKGERESEIGMGKLENYVWSQTLIVERIDDETITVFSIRFDSIPIQFEA
jgi:hypothetical protein